MHHTEDTQIEHAFKVEDLCRKLRISRSMAYKLIRNGTLPVIPGLGRCVRIPASAVYRLLSKAEVRHG